MFQYESIQSFHSALLNGEASCEATVTYYLHRITEKTHLNAFVQVYGEEALSKARLLDEKRKKAGIQGLLHGVVIALKDVISYKDHPLTASSLILRNFISSYDATVVKKLLDEDAILIGHTNCDEFAMGSTNENSAYGRVLNATDEGRVPGGSSGGSAVAVQAGLCMVSLGTDTGGSVRQPADFCGIIGFKPTYGLVSRYGVVAYASSFDQVGIFGQNVEDIARILQVISGGDTFDSTVNQFPAQAYTQFHEVPQTKRIGFLKEALDNPALDPEIGSTIRNHLKQLQNDGYSVVPISFEYLDHIVPTYYILTTAEASSNLSRYDGIRFGYRDTTEKYDLTQQYSYSRSSGFGKEVKRRIMLGTFVLSAGYYDAYFTKAQQVRQLLVNKINLIFKDFDAIVLPTTPSTAFLLGDKIKDPIAMYLADIFTVFANLTGLPAVSIPLFWHSNGLPFGLQIMTNRFSELSLLQLSSIWLARYRNSQK